MKIFGSIVEKQSEFWYLNLEFCSCLEFSSWDLGFPYQDAYIAGEVLYREVIGFLRGYSDNFKVNFGK